MPKHIQTADRDVQIFFRVCEVLHKGLVTVRDADGVIASFVRRYLAPGEMQKILRSAKTLQSANGDTLTIALEAGK